MDQLTGWDKKRLWSYLIDQGLLRAILFVGGEGPRASGMPEVEWNDSNSGFQDGCVIATDGRVTISSVTHSLIQAISLLKIKGQGMITLVRSTDSSLPIIKMDAKLLSWQMYSNNSSPGLQRR